MKKLMLIIFFALTLNSCTIASYTIRAESDDVILIDSTKPINVFVGSHPRDSAKYSKTILSYLNNRGIDSKLIESPSEATLHVEIEKAPFYSLPQEYLTGFSLGIIPSWGNRKNEFVYWVYYEETEMAIYVDEFTINHLLLLPFGLIELPFIRETAIFKKALSEYIDTQPSAAPDAHKPARP